MSIEVQHDQPDEGSGEEYIEEGRPSFPVFTIGLILCYSAVFAAQMAFGLDISVDAASDDKQAFRNGEFWRMLTGSTLHGGVLHFVLNTFAFYSFGKIFETLTGRSHLPIVFLLSAIGGSVLSLTFDPEGRSVGASGGIVGVVGYLVVYSFKRKDFVAAQFRRELLFNIGFILLYGFVLVDTVDNFAHIGGLVTGAIYALAHVPRDPYADPRVESSATSLAGLISAGIYAAASLFAILLITGSI